MSRRDAIMMALGAAILGSIQTLAVLIWVEEVALPAIWGDVGWPVTSPPEGADR